MRLRAANHPQQDGDNGEHQKNVDNTTRVVAAKIRNGPDNYQYQCDEIQQVAHKKCFELFNVMCCVVCRSTGYSIKPCLG